MDTTVGVDAEEKRKLLYRKLNHYSSIILSIA
jgi:hypothetical protein